MTDKKIGIIGCGNMGEALLGRLEKVREKSTDLMVTDMDAARRDEIQERHKIMVGIDNNYLVKYSDIIIIAVKPKDFDGVLRQEICCGISPEKLVISLGAGITTKYIESIIGKKMPVVRAMPNMAAVIGEAITVISAGSSAKKEHMDLAREILEMVGDVLEMDEKHLDAVTAVSGSGPAYFFYLMESMIEAAEDLGIDKKHAEKLVYKTAIGSAALVHKLETHPETLRMRVTSKGGTTEAAFKVFELKKFSSIVKEAMRRAYSRSKKLGRV